MAENKGTTEVPPRPKKRGELNEYFEQNKEAILIDYRRWRLLDFYKRWGITATTWTRLKREWGVTGKGRGARKRVEKTPKAQTKDIPADIEKLAKNEHERYLILVGYQMGVREFLKADKNHA